MFDKPKILPKQKLKPGKVAWELCKVQGFTSKNRYVVSCANFMSSRLSLITPINWITDTANIGSKMSQVCADLFPNFVSILYKQEVEEPNRYTG